MAASGYLSRDIRTAADVFAAHEKGSGNAIFVESFEQSWCRFAGTVIECKGQHRTAAIAMVEGLSEDTGRSSAHGVSHESRRGSHSGGDAKQPTIHVVHDSRGEACLARPLWRELEIRNADFVVTLHQESEFAIRKVAIRLGPIVESDPLLVLLDALDQVIW